MGQKRGKTNEACARGSKVYWQSANLNQRWQQFFRNQLLQLALARFRWLNLPPTCNARYLEMQLLFNGQATLASKASAPEMFYSLKCTQGNINMYGEAANWIAYGENGTSFACDNSNGVFIYDNLLRANTASAFTLLAYDMADIVRTKQTNRIHMKKPFILKGDQQYKQQMLNILNDIAGNEPAMITTRSIDNVGADVLNTGVQYIGKELTEDLQSTWNMAFTFLGIANLPFKYERQTADEIQDYAEPTSMLSLNPLMARRTACDKFNDRFGTRVWGKETPKPLGVVWNCDVETNAYRMANDMMQEVNDDGRGAGI